MADFVDPFNKTPRAYLRVSLGVGRSQAGAGNSILILGNKLAAGDAAAGTIIQRVDEDDVIAAVGEGSELHRNWLAAVDVNPDGDYWLGIVAESGGDKASGTIVITGPATSGGTLELSIGPAYRVSIPVSSGDTATVIGDRIAGFINANGVLPVTAVNAAGTVTLTAKQNGPRGNDIRVRIRQTEVAAGITVAGTLYNSGNGATLTGGTTIDDPTGILDIVGRRYRLIASGYTTQTEVDEITDHANAQAEPLIGRRGRAIFGAVDSLAARTTIVTSNNEARGQTLWQSGSPATPGEIAAAGAAAIGLAISSNPAANLDATKLSYLIEQWDQSDVPTGPELANALNNGITPVAADDNGDVAILRSITMKSQDANSNPDFRVLDTPKVDVPDSIADLIQTNWTEFSRGQNLGPHVDGEVPPPGVQTRVTVLEWALQLILPLDNVWIENFDSVTQAGATTNRNAVAIGRVDLRIPLDVIEGLHQLTADVRQVG